MTEKSIQSKNSDFENYHCEDIKRFIEIFAQLPEVKEAVITGVDTAGVKKSYFASIEPLIDYYMKSSTKKEEDDIKTERLFVSEALEK